MIMKPKEIKYPDCDCPPVTITGIAWVDRWLIMLYFFGIMGFTGAIILSAIIGACYLLGLL